MRNLLLTILLLALAAPVTGAPRNSITLRVTDTRNVITRNIDRNLVLRIVKDRSVDCENFGWYVEVIRRPYRDEKPNLVYSNPSGHGADPSQLCAWHITENHFPNERELPVKGYPYVVKAVLSNCKVAGRESQACFESGTLTVSWERRP